MTKKPLIVHVNRQKIAQNNKREHKDREPPIIVRQGDNRLAYVNELLIKINDKVIGRLKYTPDKPLDCGAKVYLELDPDASILISSNNQAAYSISFYPI